MNKAYDLTCFLLNLFQNFHLSVFESTLYLKKKKQMSSQPDGYFKLSEFRISFMSESLASRKKIGVYCSPENKESLFPQTSNSESRSNHYKLVHIHREPYLVHWKGRQHAYRLSIDCYWRVNDHRKISKVNGKKVKIITGWPTLVCLYVEVQRRTSIMGSSLVL